jgi:uncharacterized protein YidB (DUF937 family)
VKARTYIATVDTTDKVKQIKAGLEATSTEALRLARAELKAKFNQNLGHAIEAAANNFLVQNPLKDALVAAAVGMGVQEHQASALVDDAFFTHGQTTLAGLLDQAEEWSNTAPEALDTILRAMRGAGRRPRASASVSAGYNHALAARMASAAVAVQPQMVSASVADPVEQPAQPEAQVSSKDAYRAKFGRFNARR